MSRRRDLLAAGFARRPTDRLEKSFRLMSVTRTLTTTMVVICGVVLLALVPATAAKVLGSACFVLAAFNFAVTTEQRTLIAAELSKRAERPQSAA